MTPLWQWHHDSEHPYLTTSLLASWPHGFFTCQSWPTPPAVLTQQLDSAATPYRAKQVHGQRVMTPEQLPTASAISDQPLPEADAVATSAARQAAWVCTADCTPALVADVHSGRVAAVHAGWRGTALQILPETIRHLQTQGSQVADLRVALGPAIAGEVYQVTTHVALEVGRSLAPATVADQDLLAQLQTLADPPLLPDEAPGKVRLDVRRINALQLLSLGLQPEHIAIAPHCTYQEPERFFSYRRTREKKVQWSGIVSR